MITLTMQQMENVKNDRKRSHAGTTQQTEASRTTGVTLFPLRMDEAPRGFLMRTTQAGWSITKIVATVLSTIDKRLLQQLLIVATISRSLSDTSSRR